MHLRCANWKYLVTFFLHRFYFGKWWKIVAKLETWRERAKLKNSPDQRSCVWFMIIYTWLEYLSEATSEKELEIKHLSALELREQSLLTSQSDCFMIWPRGAWRHLFTSLFARDQLSQWRNLLPRVFASFGFLAISCWFVDFASFISLHVQISFHCATRMRLQIHFVEWTFEIED